MMTCSCLHTTPSIRALVVLGEALGVQAVKASVRPLRCGALHKGPSVARLLVNKKSQESSQSRHIAGSVRIWASQSSHHVSVALDVSEFVNF